MARSLLVPHSTKSDSGCTETARVGRNFHHILGKLPANRVETTAAKNVMPFGTPPEFGCACKHLCRGLEVVRTDSARTSPKLWREERYSTKQAEFAQCELFGTRTGLNGK